MFGLGLGLGLDTDGLVNVTARLQDFLHNGLLLICFQFWTCAVMFFKTKTSAVKTKTAQKWSWGAYRPRSRHEDNSTGLVCDCIAAADSNKDTISRRPSPSQANTDSGTPYAAIGWTHPIDATESHQLKYRQYSANKLHFTISYDFSHFAAHNLQLRPDRCTLAIKSMRQWPPLQTFCHAISAKTWTVR